MFKYVGKDNKIEEKKLLDLTISEFKEIIREVVAEEISKHNFITPSPVIPPQPYYYQPVEPWGKEYEITYDTKTTPKMKENK